MPAMRQNGETQLLSPGAAVLAIGITNTAHFLSFIQQGGFEERYGEWLKARFDFCEGIRAVVTDRKGRHKVVSRVQDTIYQEANSSETGVAASAENSEEAPDAYEGYYSSEKD